MATISQTRHSSSTMGFDRLQGVWRSRGYGMVLLIDGDEYAFFEETAISCLRLHTGPLEELDHRYEDLAVSPGQQAFSARRATGVTRVGFRRLQALPDTVADTLERHLPNGWHLTLSNEVYQAFDGEVYEDVGIPPHIRLPFLGRMGRESGRDPMLDRALRLAG